MKIWKAILLTLLIISIEAAIPLISFLSFEYFGDPAYFEHNYGITIILCRIIAYSTVFFFFWKPKKEFVATPLNRKTIILFLLIAIGLEFVGRPFWDFDKILSYFNNTELEPINYEFQGYNMKFIYRTILTLILAPLLEELFFRGFLITKLIAKYKIIVTLLVSSSLFSLIHWETPANLIPAFLFGMISGWIFIKTGNISYSILLHFFYNFLGALSVINMEWIYEWLFWLKYDYLYWTLFLSGIVISLCRLKYIPLNNHKKLL